MHQPPSFGVTNKRNRAYRNNSAQLTRWLDTLAHFDTSIKYMAGNNLILTDYFSGHLTAETSTEKNYEKEYVLFNSPELFVINHGFS